LFVREPTDIGENYSIKMIICTTTKPLKEEAFSNSDHEKKARRKIQELTLKARSSQDHVKKKYIY